MSAGLRTCGHGPSARLVSLASRVLRPSVHEEFRFHLPLRGSSGFAPDSLFSATTFHDGCAPTDTTYGVFINSSTQNIRFFGGGAGKPHGACRTRNGASNLQDFSGRGRSHPKPAGGRLRAANRHRRIVWNGARPLGVVRYEPGRRRLEGGMHAGCVVWRVSCASAVKYPSMPPCRESVILAPPRVSRETAMKREAGTRLRQAGTAPATVGGMQACPARIDIMVTGAMCREGRRSGIARSVHESGDRPG